ncbi:SRPBCC family protein [uncultured Tateyamaria sp.]|uniref:SRPBCC family protein n=1 Tax=uncultured Tateyamaria sp. TaxID=455651 RepID=UPI00260A783F|nr:SRPBCC family protein [uncultured Tateyamaria sp.]
MRTFLQYVACAAAIGVTSPLTANAQDWARSFDAAITKDITLRRNVSVRFDQAPAEILPLLLTRVDLYDPNIVEVRFDHSQSEVPGQFGVGSRRICVFADGRELVEPLVVYDPPYTYAYTVDADASTMNLPVRDIVLLYAFEANKTGGTDLTVQAYFDPRIPGTGPVIEPVLTGTFRRTFQTASETFGGTYLGDEKP